MHVFTEVITASEAFDDAVLSLTLPYQLRRKSRLRVTLDNGEEAGLQLPRGSVLRDGWCLRAGDGTVVRILAAAEPVSTAYTGGPEVSARAAYHLGNRHVPVQIGDGWVRYRADHVLDDMLRSLGLRVVNETAPFEPEEGAYAHAHHYE